MGHDEMLAECLDFKKRTEKFMSESIGQGGYRERLLKVEMEISILKKDVLRGSIIGGIIGALIGSGAAPAVTALIHFLIKVA